MKEFSKYVGLDTHKETIAVAVEHQKQALQATQGTVAE